MSDLPMSHVSIRREGPVLEGLVGYVAQVLRPWVWPAALAAGVCFAIFGALRLWVLGPGVRMARHTRAQRAPDGGPTALRSLGGWVIRGFVWLVAVFSNLFGKIASVAAILACVGFLAAAITSPAQAGAGESLLTQAQQALRSAIPAQYGDVTNLAAPGVTTKNGSTTFTFRIPAKSGAKSAKVRTYSVTIGPDGVKVGQTP
jgi:hypothetical protein